MATKITKATSKISQQTHFRNSLKKAQGRAEQVIIVFVDVRGFSAFSSNRDSVDIGLYARRLFLSLINKYFPHASFYKSTGDGMLIVYPYQEKNLTKIANQVIKSALSLIVEFPDLAAEDEMITFIAPKSCGIGINRGTVCCIESDGETLDYSGHVLNLAARLMDLARPEGIVMHASLGNMIPDEYKEIFEISSVFVRGIAEDQPVPVYSLKGATSIPESATLPRPEPWGIYTQKWSVAQVKKLGKFTYTVPNTVTKNDDVVVRFYTPGSIKGFRTIHDINSYQIEKVADKTEVVIDMKSVQTCTVGHEDNVEVTLDIKYRQHK